MFIAAVRVTLSHGCCRRENRKGRPQDFSEILPAQVNSTTASFFLHLPLGPRFPADECLGRTHRIALEDGIFESDANCRMLLTQAKFLELEPEFVQEEFPRVRYKDPAR